jgi:D-galactarolactone isomerase
VNETPSLPDGTCDTHIHFYDHRYPTARSTILEPPDAGPADYAKVAAQLGIDRCVVVQPTTYGLDNRCQLDAVAALGSIARAVVVIDEHTDEADLLELHRRGARGARFHMLSGGAVGWDSLDPVAAHIGDLGWHVQLQLDGRTLPDHLDRLRALPCGLVIDHIGRFMPPVATDDPGFAALAKLVEEGAWVKLSAPYESDATAAPEFAAVSRIAQALVTRRPDRMLWATNWPHPGQAAPPTPAEIVAMLERWVPDASTLRTILVDNPAELYGFGPVAVG